MDINALHIPLQFKIIQLDAVSSTNTVLREMLNQAPQEAGLVIAADYQTGGRGQVDTVWESERGLNLLCSVLLQPNFLAIDQQIYLNMAMCLAVYDVIREYTPEVLIKWPNDVYVRHQKVCGILIENQLAGSKIKSSIVGVGLNVNQQQFKEAKATSLSVVKNTLLDKDEILNKLLQAIHTRYQLLFLKQFEKLNKDYHNVLLGLNELRKFQSGLSVFNGVIKQVNEQGMLVVEVKNELKKFRVKEIKML